jgi:hypothetical protein
MKNQKNSIILAALLLCFFLCNASQAAASGGLSITGSTLTAYHGTAAAVTVPKKVKIIGKKSFAGNKKIQKVVIKQGITTIRAAAFQNCTKLKTVEIPDSVEKIAANAFLGCKKLTILAKKGSYALKFAKKKGIPWKVKASEQTSAETESFYHITGITCYWYTAGTYPCIAQKKTVTQKDTFDRIYEEAMLFNSGETAGEEDMISGGKTLRIVIQFSDKESRTIECNPGVYMENGVSNKLAEGVSLQSFWDLLEGELSEETL